MTAARHLAACALLAGLALTSASCTEGTPPHSPHDGARESGRVMVEVHAPSSVPYAPALLGTGPAPVMVVVANDGVEPLDVSRLAVRFEASGGGVAVRCVDEAPPRTAEPTTLAAGARRTFDRSLDCRLPLAGPYQVAVSVAFGRDRAWRLVRTYEVEVVAAAGLEPRPLNDSGLVATIGGALESGTADRRGHPRIALALINTGTVPLEIPPLRVETRVRRQETPWTCTSAAVPLSSPPAIAAGATFRHPFDVSCLGFDVRGSYDVEVVLLVGSDRAVSLGHLRIDVTDDPARVLPAPLPSPSPAPTPAATVPQSTPAL